MIQNFSGCLNPFKYQNFFAQIEHFTDSQKTSLAKNFNWNVALHIRNHYFRSLWLLSKPEIVTMFISIVFG